jgi:hypothetical protein
MINCLASFCGSRGDSRSTIQFIRTLASLWLPLTDDYLRAGNFLTHSPSSLVEVWLSDCVFLLGTELLSLSRIESVAHCLPCAGQVNYPNCKQCIQGRFGRAPKLTVSISYRGRYHPRIPNHLFGSGAA